MSFETVEQARAHIEANLAVILIRECIDDKWGEFSLEEMPKDMREYHIQKFLDENRMPVMLKREMLGTTN